MKHTVHKVKDKEDYEYRGVQFKKTLIPQGYFGHYITMLNLGESRKRAGSRKVLLSLIDRHFDGDPSSTEPKKEISQPQFQIVSNEFLDYLSDPTQDKHFNTDPIVANQVLSHMNAYLFEDELSQKNRYDQYLKLKEEFGDFAAKD